MKWRKDYIEEITYSDLLQLSDVMFDISGEDITKREDLEKIFEMLSTSTKIDCLRWGISDTVIKETIYRELKTLLTKNVNN